MSLVVWYIWLFVAAFVVGLLCRMSAWLFLYKHPKGSEDMWPVTRGLAIVCLIVAPAAFILLAFYIGPILARNWN